MIPVQGKAIPYGVYDLQRNEGWVRVGTDHDTAACAVHAIRRWRLLIGRSAYRRAQSLLITADAGGSNGPRLHLCERELQQFDNRAGLVITVCHFPPGTSKWNKIEHRLLFPHRHELARHTVGEPGGHRQPDRVHDHEHRPEGLHRDRQAFLPQGVVVTSQQIAKVQSQPHAFHPVNLYI